MCHGKWFHYSLTESNWLHCKKCSSAWLNSGFTMIMIIIWQCGSYSQHHPLISYCCHTMAFHYSQLSLKSKLYELQQACLLFGMITLAPMISFKWEQFIALALKTVIQATDYTLWHISDFWKWDPYDWTCINHLLHFTWNWISSFNCTIMHVLAMASRRTYWLWNRFWLR